MSASDFSVDRSRDALNAGKTVWEEMSDGGGVIGLGKTTTPSHAGW